MNWVTGVPFVYPALEAVHIVGIALLLGSLVVFELRVWGLGRALELHAAGAPRPADRRRRLRPRPAAAARSCSSARSTRCSATSAFVLKMGLVALAGLNAMAFTCAAGSRPTTVSPGPRPRCRWGFGSPSSSAVDGSPTSSGFARRKDLACNAVPCSPSLPPDSLPALARAHHGWSGFDQDRPIYLEGKAESVVWRNPHAELDAAPRARRWSCRPTWPSARCRRSRPRSTRPKVLAATRLPTRKDPVWELELAPLTRMEAWKVAEIKAGPARSR